MKTQYSFVTKWEIETSLPQVWDAIYNSMEWPQWWKGVLSVKEIEKEDANGINGVNAYTWKSVLPYELTFSMRLTEKEPMKRLKTIQFKRHPILKTQLLLQSQLLLQNLKVQNQRKQQHLYFKISFINYLFISISDTEQ